MTIVKAALAAILATIGVAAPLDGPPARQPGDHMAFLERLTGEWSVVAEATLGPGQAPVRTEAREVARLLGGKWLVAESTGTAPNGQAVTSIRTLGYAPAEKRFVGTWISSMQSHLWWHTGTLDASGAVLTLETDGPIMGDPTNEARYREVIEIESDDLHVVRSLILGPDGEWFEFARAEYRRE